MMLRELADILQAEELCNTKGDNVQIEIACGCDLMSDVLRHAKAQCLLLTGLTTPQTVYTAEMADIKAICYVRGKRPQQDVINLAKSKGIILLATTLPMFESCGKLYKHGIKGCSEV
jgi:hypothetical protein